MPDAARRFVPLLASLAFVVAACSGSASGSPPAAPTSPDHEATTTPEPAPSVTGVGKVRRMPVSNGPVVFSASDPNAAVPDPDEGAIDAFIRASARWLDTHLTDLNRGGEGRLEEVAMDGLLDSVDAEAVLAITTDLASPDRLVEAATYDVLVAIDGAPQWLRVTVETTWRDGGGARAQFIFVPDGAGTRLVAAGPLPEDLLPDTSVATDDDVDAEEETDR